MLSKCLPNLSFLSFRFDRQDQKYYHAWLMSAQTVIDSLEFARARQELRGNLSVASLARLQDCLYDTAGSVEFAVTGGCDDEKRPILALDISGLLHLQCQRCLESMDYPLRLANTLLLVRPGENPDETVADPDAIDYVEASTEMDIAGLIEDEILLSLPFSPRHKEGECGNRAPGAETDKPGAFARLAELKKI